MVPLVLYSTNTWLAYAITQRYYGGRHYVWCTPYRGLGSGADVDNAVPPSSDPFEIYRMLHFDVLKSDAHSPKIRDNRAGLLAGAAIRKANGEINDCTEKEISAVVNIASVRDFRPLLYVIPYYKVSKVIREVPVNKRAHPLSEEYIISGLRVGSFDVLQLPIGGTS